MRIWYFNHYASPPDQPTTGAFYLMQALARRGHEVTIFASGFNYYQGRDLRLGDRWFTARQETDGLTFRWIRATPTQGRPLSRFFNMLSYAVFSLLAGLDAKPEPDIIIASCPHALTGFSAWLLSRFRGAKFVYEIRDIWPESLTEGKIISERSLFARVIAALQRFLYRRAALMLSVLPKFDDYLSDIGIKPRAFLWLPNGVEIIPESLPPPLHIEAPTPFCLMFIGGFSRYQGLGVLLEAARILEDRKQNIRIALVGGGSEKPHVIENVRRMGLKHIEFREAVPRAEVMAVAAEADAFILHARPLLVHRYGLSPNKLCDYMLAARPVIYSAPPEHNPVAETGCGILIPPQNPQALADAVIKLAAMPRQQLREMGLRGRDYALAHFDAAKLAGRLETALLTRSS
ncbi:MAG: glycosyltransferase family 4 protein [Pseudomonadota bacterium]|nr:glycosyltransferase family 4 protein [Pseudomonadota bacterium]MDE3038093.1 glycosyltransferase family 4 protein [Pseudomonadota bacterium]